MMRCIAFLLLLLLTAIKGQAQSYTLYIHPLDSLSPEAKRLLPAAKDFKSAGAVPAALQAIVPDLQREGYLGASVDSVSIAGTRYDAYVFTGQKYHWARLSMSQLPPALLINTGIVSQHWEGRNLQPATVSGISERILKWCDGAGYPFARVHLDSITLDNKGGLSAALVLDPGDYRRIDTIVVDGNLKLSKEFLERYLDIAQGSAYSEAKLRNISPRIRELPYAQEAGPWNVTFKPGATRLNLFLKERSANQVNALIGIVPDASGTGKLRLTADLLASFQNILAHGEALSLSFQNLQYKSPRLRLDAVWPYLFGTAFGAEGHFDFYQRDTTFNRTSLQLGTRYQISALDYLRVYYESSGNRVGTIDTAFARANHRLPDNIDVSTNGGGAELSLSRVDYRLNPRKGFTARLGGTALLRAVRKNDAILGISDGSGFDYARLYDSLSNRQYQYRLSGDAAYYFPLAKNLVLKVAYSGGIIISPQLFQNETYLIGGFRLLRGFDEGGIYASQYHVGLGELRALLGRSSYVFIFSDNGYVESRFNGYSRTGWYHGFGAGATLETKGGLFTIGYALGKSPGTPIVLRDSKIYFGYAAYF